jgi:hypothetical protein
MKTMKWIFVILATSMQVACDSGSAGATSATTASTNTCTNSSGQIVTCSEVVAPNSGSQVVSGSTTTNVAQVPSTSIVAARAVTPSTVSDQQIQAKAAQVQAQTKNLSMDPESATASLSNAPSEISPSSVAPPISSVETLSSPQAAESEIYNGGTVR